MNSLYPIKFEPIIKDKIWGGNRLQKQLGKNPKDLPNIGESWEISSVPGELSVVANGWLRAKNIEEIIKIFTIELVGKKVFEKFGTQFPLLIKFIDANQYLSVQVHPDDILAKNRHNSFGKTEMWYVIDAEKDAELIVGFNQELTKKKYLQHMAHGTLRNVLNFEKVTAGDVFHLPAGRIHATGPGILFAEIQQTSDITYRIYDWDRVDDAGRHRELHTELAVDAIDFENVQNFKTLYSTQLNKTNKIIACQYYTTNLIVFDEELKIDYTELDSFVIYMVLEGEASLVFSENDIPLALNRGETVLIPAQIKKLKLNPKGTTTKLLEVYIDI